MNDDQNLNNQVSQSNPNNVPLEPMQPVENGPVITPTPNANPFPTEPVMMDPMMNSQPKSKMPFIIIGAVLIIGLLVGLYLVFGVKKGVAKETFNKSLNNQITKFNQLINKTEQLDVAKKVFENKGTMKLHFELNSDHSSLRDFSGYKFDITAGIDINRNEFGMILNVKDKINNRLDVDLFGQSNNIYIDLGNMFDRVLVTKLDEPLDLSSLIESTSNGATELNEEDVAYLLDKVIESVFKVVEEKDLTETEVNETIYEKKLNLTKITYLLNAERLEKINNAVLTDLIADDKALGILAEINGMDQTKADVKSDLEDELNNFQLPEDFEDTTINAYVTGEYELIKLEANSKSIEMSFIGYEEKYTIISNSSVNNESIEIVFDDKDEDVIDFKIDVEGMNASGKLRINDSSNESMAKADINIDMTVKSAETNNEAIDMNVIINYSFDESYTFTAPSIYETVNFDTMTMEDMNQLMTNISNNPIIKASGLLDLFMY